VDDYFDPRRYPLFIARKIVREFSRAELNNIARLSEQLETGELKTALNHLLARHHPD